MKAEKYPNPQGNRVNMNTKMQGSKPARIDIGPRSWPCFRLPQPGGLLRVSAMGATRPGGSLHFPQVDKDGAKVDSCDRGGDGHDAPTC